MGLLALGLDHLDIWWRARSAARQARHVSLQVSERMSRFEAVEVISVAIAAMDEIKGLHRSSMEFALHRYSGLRKNLAIADTAMTIVQRGRIANALSQFRIMEAEVDRAVASGVTKELDVARFNGVLSRLMDELPKIMVAMKQAGV